MNVPKEPLSETKCTIMSVARELFSRFGFEGASIRDIAKKSGVNLAAINYHFKNKENLFWETIGESYLEAEKITINISLNATNTQDFAVLLFDQFRERPDLIRNTMKMLLTEKMDPPKDSVIAQKIKSTLGPPGAAQLAALLAKEIPFTMNPLGLMWGVKMIFGNIVHWSTMCTTAHFEAICASNPLQSPEQVRWDISQAAIAVVNHIKNHPEFFKAK